jgi:hypothetical protein
MPERRTVFISCGQYAEEEKKLGQLVCELVDKYTPFRGYFAENQTTLKALSENVLSRLYESVGLIVIMHHRGAVEMPGRKFVRASVWIEQEIALATLMEQVLRRPLHVALFIQQGIAIEGIRQQLQMNAIEFTNSDKVIAHLRELLPTWTEPLYVGDDELRKTVDSVDLSIAFRVGMNFNFTIEIENHSKVDVEVKSVVLWSKGIRVCKPVVPQEGILWRVPAQRTIPIQFLAKEDVAMKLVNIYGEPGALANVPKLFKAELKTDIRCEILGMERSFEETSNVQVDYRNRQINGL